MIKAETIQNTENAENPAGPKGIQVTERAIKRIRTAMAKEGISPQEGGLRLGIQGKK